MMRGELRLLDHWTAETARSAVEVLRSPVRLRPLAEAFGRAVDAADVDDDSFRQALVGLAANCLVRLVDLDTTVETLTEGRNR